MTSSPCRFNVNVWDATGRPLRTVPDGVWNSQLSLSDQVLTFWPEIVRSSAPLLPTECQTKARSRGAVRRRLKGQHEVSIDPDVGSLDFVMVVLERSHLRPSRRHDAKCRQLVIETLDQRRSFGIEFFCVSVARRRIVACWHCRSTRVKRRAKIAAMSHSEMAMHAGHYCAADEYDIGIAVT